MSSFVNSLSSHGPSLIWEPVDRESLSAPSEKEEDLSVPLNINSLPDEVLGLIFNYASKDSKGRLTHMLGSIRAVCFRWHQAVDSEILSHCWSAMKKEIRNPALQTSIYHSDLANDFVDRAIRSALSPLTQDLNLPERSHCSRFCDMTEDLKRQEAPIPTDVTVLGFEAHPYEKMQKKLDKALKWIWSDIRPQIDFGGSPAPVSIQEIRRWLNNKENIHQLETVSMLFLSESPPPILFSQISKFPQLTTLALNANDLTMLPLVLGDLSNLKKLNLGDNQFNVFPRVICTLFKLEELFLDENQLSSIPEEIGELTNLNILDLNHNQFTAFPNPIGRLSSLEILYLSNNALETLSDPIGNLTNLSKLDLSHNRLTTLPAAIQTLSQLSSLALSHNQLSVFPNPLLDLRSLRTLEIHHNQITAIPEKIAQLNNLIILEFDNNRLTTLPGSVDRLENLIHLNLAHNRLQSIPNAIGRLYSLVTLDLQHNRLTAIPLTIRNLGRLAIFRLNDNPLICNLQSLLLGRPVADDRLPGNEGYFPVEDMTYDCYRCATPLASLCQAIYFGCSTADLQEKFEALPLEMKSLIQQQWAAIPSASGSSSDAVNDLLADRADFTQALIAAMKHKLQALSHEDWKLVYAQIALLAGRSQNEINWGQAHAHDNVLRLIDAMEMSHP